VDKHLQELLHEIEEHGRANDAHETDHSRRMLNLEPASAQLLSILARASGVKRVLEFGTSSGYSTIWLAWSVAPVDGSIISIDRNPHKHALAVENLRRAGFLDRAELRTGDVTEIVRELAGPFDLVFLDADRRKFPEILKIVLPKLASKVLVIADNVTSHPEEIEDYLRVITNMPDFQHTTVPVGKGLSVAFRG